jgi:hypothetical protein
MAKTARRCPRCSSIDTGVFRGQQLCEKCQYRWTPCSDQYCRGYKIELGPVPRAVGCSECDREHGGVQDGRVIWWPEVYRAIARKLEELERACDNGPSDTWA